MSKITVEGEIQRTTKGEEFVATLEIDLDGAFLGEYDETAEEFIAQVSEPEAIQLICDLIAAFNLPKANIEVLYFPSDCDRADVLRQAADRIDTTKIRE